MFRLADRQSVKSNCKHRLGAVIVKGGRVLSTGYNEIRYSRFIQATTVHAEEAAIIKLLDKKALSQLVSSELYVSRTCPSGNSGLARPCSRCMDLIKSVGIKRVHYTTDNGITESIKL